MLIELSVAKTHSQYAITVARTTARIAPAQAPLRTVFNSHSVTDCLPNPANTTQQKPVALSHQVCWLSTEWFHLASCPSHQQTAQDRAPLSYQSRVRCSVVRLQRKRTVRLQDSARQKKQTKPSCLSPLAGKVDLEAEVEVRSVLQCTHVYHKAWCYDFYDSVVTQPLPMKNVET